MRTMVQAGFTLVEALVALLVVALGAAGAGLLHVRALRTTREAAHLADAVQVAAALAARMAANRVVMGGADADNPYLHPRDGAAACFDAGCTPSQLAAFDIDEARADAAARLPGGRIVVCRDLARPDAVTGLLPWGCLGGPGAPLLIKLGWRSAGAADAPRVVLPVRGLTLVELLVALAVGLGVVLGAGRLALLANEGHAAQAALADIDDGGRYALDALGRAVRLGAGPGAALAGLDAATLGRATAALDDPLPDAAGSDVLAVRFPGAPDGSALDCAGFAIPADTDGWSIFYVARNAQQEPELRCKYRGAARWSADAIVAGVDAFQVLYGIDTDTPRDGVPNRYVNATTLTALDAWRRVVTVRVGLLLHASARTRRTPGSTTFDLLGGAYAGGPRDPGTALREADLPPAERLRERRLFTATFNVPAPDT